MNKTIKQQNKENGNKGKLNKNTKILLLLFIYTPNKQTKTK